MARNGRSKTDPLQSRLDLKLKGVSKPCFKAFKFESPFTIPAKVLPMSRHMCYPCPDTIHSRRYYERCLHKVTAYERNATFYDPIKKIKANQSLFDRYPCFWNNRYLRFQPSSPHQRFVPDRARGISIERSLLNRE